MADPYEGQSRLPSAIVTSRTEALTAKDESNAQAKLAEEYFLYYTDLLQETRVSWVRFWKLYFAKKEDHRKEIEKKWRANIFVPRPFISVETRVAVLMDIMLSSDPIIQAEGAEERDQGPDRDIERLLDYTLRANRWRLFQEMLFRDMSVQGTAAFKSTWGERSIVLPVFPTARDQRDFALAVKDAMMKGAPPPPADFEVDPQGFEEWRMLVNKAGKGPVPEPPLQGPKQFVQYRGPIITRVPMWDLYYDPLIDDFDAQHCVIHRTVQTKKWLELRTGDEPDKPFDPVLVEAAMSKWDGQKLSEHEVEIYNKLGIPSKAESNDPYMKNSVEIWEVWKLGDEQPFQIILNRTQRINKARDLPYHHGQNPIRLVRNVAIGGLANGLSDLQVPETLFYELNSFRNLRLDAATLNTLPVLTKLREMGLTELDRRLEPGLIIPVSRGDALQQLIKANLPAEAYREPQEIVRDIEDATKAGPNVQGATSVVGRVSATESQNRLQQALLGHKLSAIRIEEEQSPAVKQWLVMWYQFSESDIRKKISGADKYLEVSKGMLLEALDMDFRFRGATRAANRDLLAQQLMGFFDKFGVVMTVPEVRHLMKTTAEVLNLRGIDKIVSAEGTLQKTLEVQMAQAAQAAQAQAGLEQTQAAGVVPPEAPKAAPELEG